jgi:branched-subunit amino acid aminotransferase/4-amino-4-deoxychorismate lyase
MQRIRPAGVRVISLLDGVEVDALPLDDPGLLLGDAVFETMRAYSGRPFALGEHLARLARSAEWARMPMPDALEAEITTVAKRIEGDAAVRAFVFRKHRLVTAEPLEIGVDYERGVSACVLPNAEYGTPESAHAKYARYLPRLLARDEAKRRGFGDALLADAEGRIVSAATGSVFAFVGGTLVTSSILEGITRAHVLRLAREAWIDCTLRPIEAADLERATEVFVTSSLREVVPVVRVDSRSIGNGTPGPVTQKLHAALRATT